MQFELLLRTTIGLDGRPQSHPAATSLAASCFFWFVTSGSCVYRCRRGRCDSDDDTSVNIIGLSSVSVGLFFIKCSTFACRDSFRPTHARALACKLGARQTQHEKTRARAALQASCCKTCTRSTAAICNAA